MAASQTQERWVVLYDGACGFCKWTLAGLLRLDRSQRLQPLALQREEAEGFLAEIEPELRMASFHLVTPNGELLSAGAALPPLLRLLRWGRLPAAVLARFPAPTAAGYRWIAEHRTQLSRFVPARWKRRAAERVREHEGQGF